MCKRVSENRHCTAPVNQTDDCSLLTAGTAHLAQSLPRKKLSEIVAEVESARSSLLQMPVSQNASEW